MPDTVPRYVRLLWGVDEDARPGPKRSLDIHEIAAAGVRLADAGGIGALSMRAVAAEVGLTSMALYRYVESKRELELLVLDAAYGPPPTLPSRRGWRPQLRDWGTALRDGLVAHPWVVTVPVAEPPLLPNSVRWMERALHAMRGCALTEQQKLSALLLVDVYVRGQVALAAGVDPGQDGDDRAHALYSRRLRALADPGEFPRLHEALRAGALDDGGSDFAVDEFGFGLDVVLDGIAGLMADG